MILETALFFAALGFGCWITGAVFDHPEIAVIGGVLLLAMGAMVADGGLEYQDGQIEQEDPDTNTTTVDHTYSATSPPQHLSLGALIMILGGAFTLQAINRFQEL